MLINNKTLKKLDLRWNEIGAKGAEFLLIALTENKTIEKLDLAGN